MAGKTYHCTFIMGEYEFSLNLNRVPQIGEHCQYYYLDKLEFDGKVVSISTIITRGPGEESYRITLEI